ncbi:MAG TPA: tRNA (adenosine(37)-N6)-threonylcarbamoyltransferase complex ATPase subunit type 1 TsaE [Casimicrobiaceae bacterium]|nr:tRNA (adenosine(37)-N6)-threonylcarbamoyltransferase complex ATPase subunit type 1 TsaE [Casimicrobiaceae bacterium]
MTQPLTLELSDAHATEAAGARIAPFLAPGMIVTLAGELGAGKTTLARGMLRALGWEGPVKSPTFTLVEHYPFSNLYLYHFDFYRFDTRSRNAVEWDDAGVAEAFRDDTVCLVEWPERVASLLPPVDLAITLCADDEGGRRLEACANSDRGRRCLNALAAN